MFFLVLGAPGGAYRVTKIGLCVLSTSAVPQVAAQCAGSSPLLLKKRRPFFLVGVFIVFQPLLGKTIPVDGFLERL